MPDLVFSWTMGARSSAIFADGLVVAIILFQTIQIRRRLAGHRTKAARLITVFMRDGTMYFAILFVVYVISVGLGRIFEYMDMMMSWISGLSSVLMARFMLELRAIGSGAHDDGIAQTSTTGTGSMVFATEGASRRYARRLMRWDTPYDRSRYLPMMIVRYGPRILFKLSKLNVVIGCNTVYY
ncbi:hypothetical protein A0H81_12159 [Grifola frondosa]|uniref:Uncharacterized protein n=1 Tax=Grifola frondosa TaxID=5627 RepID=A0A1C7LSG7_GRIFR|nr:hypothetical protein A0H81_12159 [Grifola frondosa]